MCVSMCYAESMPSKDVGVRIRVEKELREAFQGACVAQNRQASDVLREFMRSFAHQHSDGLQASLFAVPAMARKKGRSQVRNSK